MKKIINYKSVYKSFWYLFSSFWVIWTAYSFISIITSQRKIESIFSFFISVVLLIISIFCIKIISKEKPDYLAMVKIKDKVNIKKYLEIISLNPKNDETLKLILNNANMDNGEMYLRELVKKDMKKVKKNGRKNNK